MGMAGKAIARHKRDRVDGQASLPSPVAPGLKVHAPPISLPGENVLALRAALQSGARMAVGVCNAAALPPPSDVTVAPFAASFASGRTGWRWANVAEGGMRGPSNLV